MSFTDRDRDLIGLGFYALFEKIETLDRNIRNLTKKEKQVSADLSALTDEVANNTSVVNSARTLIQSLADQVEEAGTDPVALQGLVDTLRTNDSDLAAAVAANTPAQEPPVDSTEPPVQ